MRVTLKNENDRCPISLEEIQDLEDATVVTKTGWIYSRFAVKEWLSAKAAAGDLNVNDPATNIQLPEIAGKNNASRFFQEVMYHNSYMQMYSAFTAFLITVAFDEGENQFPIFLMVYAGWIVAYINIRLNHPGEVFTQVQKTIFPDRHGLEQVLQEKEQGVVEEWLVRNTQSLQGWNKEVASDAEMPVNAGMRLRNGF